MSLEEWKKLYDKLEINTIIKDNGIYMKTGVHQRIMCLEFEEHYDVFERYIKWEIKTPIKPEMVDFIKLTINGNNAIVFQSFHDSDKLKANKECVKYNGGNNLYWTLHVDNLVPVEPTQGAKWDCEFADFETYWQSKYNKARLSDFQGEKIHLAYFLLGSEIIETDKGYMYCMSDYRTINKGNNGLLLDYPRSRVLPKIFNSAYKMQINHYRKLDRECSEIEIRTYIINCIAYIAQGNGTWVLKRFDSNGEIFYDYLSNKSAKSSVLGLEKRKYRGKLRSLYDIACDMRHELEYDTLGFQPCRSLIDFYYEKEKVMFNEFMGFNHSFTKVFDMEIVNKILDHFRNVFAKNDEVLFEYLLNWMADIVQFPDRKIGKALLVRGVEGAGKTSWWNWFGQCVLNTKYYLECEFGDISGKFNNILGNKILTVIGEAKNGEMSKYKEKVKRMITDIRTVIERKGVDSRQVDNFNRYIVLTNERIPIKISTRDRRWVILDSNEVYVNDSGYWRNLFANILNHDNACHFYNYLMMRDITDFNFNKIPETQARMEIKIDSQNFPIQFLIDYSANIGIDETFIPTDLLYNLFEQWMLQNRFKQQINKISFSRDVAGVIGKLAKTEANADGVRQRGYKLCRESLVNSIRVSLGGNFVFPDAE
ncbi:hypothetical protein F-VV57_0001 [Faustovirus]|nr:hypothetical protein F-VV57_0001 [Faustovirus]QJX73268.1 hypothetical protein F-VV63_0002 [Faustovirus]